MVGESTAALQIYSDPDVPDRCMSLNVFSLQMGIGETGVIAKKSLLASGSTDNDHFPDPGLRFSINIPGPNSQVPKTPLDLISS